MSDYQLELLEFKNKYLAEAVLLLAQDLIRAGMSNYQPENIEMLELGKWAHGLIEHLEIDLSKLEIYTEEIF